MQGFIEVTSASAYAREPDQLVAIADISRIYESRYADSVCGVVQLKNGDVIRTSEGLHTLAKMIREQSSPPQPDRTLEFPS